MQVKKIEVKNYRNLKDLTFVPHKNINVICGENAQGKTNLIESIWLFTGAKSFRGNSDSELVKIGEEKAKLNLDFTSCMVEKSSEIIIEGRRKATLNGNRLKSASLLAGSFTAIVFSPDDLQLISLGPDKRRRFLDIAVSQLYPPYLKDLKQYTRAVTQRNSLLKDIKAGQADSNLLSFFEDEIAKYGAKIIKYRKRYIERIKPFLNEIYKGISAQKEVLDIIYHSNTDESLLKNALYDSRKDDIYTASTSVGPHRDDLIFTVNEKNAKKYASQGQRRSISLSLKLAEAEVLNEITGEYPVALLDDVMSELDPMRQDYVLNKVKNRQVFITCCDPDNTKGLNEGKIFYVKNGEIKEENF